MLENITMSEDNIKELLARLQDELEKTDTIDPETRKLVRELDEDIHRLVDPDDELVDWDGLVDRANSIEARFAAEHPSVARFLREVMASLSRVGI